MLSNKLADITPSFTIAISAKVTELQSQGHNVINFGIGEPNFNIPSQAKLAGIESLHFNKTKYDKVPGLVELREAICQKLKNENNVEYSINEVVVSSGAKNAITNALMVLLNNGDEVIVPKPYWVSYPEMIKLTGGVPIFADTTKENDFKITPDEIENIATSKTKMIFISNPSNPSGVIYSKEELKAIVDVCYDNNIYILADEIYERICFDTEFVSVASLSDKAKEITITINGLSKSAAMTGLRIGYSASNLEIAKGISTIQGHLISHPSTTAQWIALSAITNCESDIVYMKDQYKLRRDKGVEILNSIPNITYAKPQGAFYLFIDVSKYKDSIAYSDSFSIEFCNILLDKERVAVVPGVAFGMDDFIRISYACDMDILIEGLNKIKKFLSNL